MLNFTVPLSLEACVSRIESADQRGTSPTLYTRATISNVRPASASFRFELWFASLRLGHAQGALVRDGDNATRVQGIAFANNLIQMGVVLFVVVALLLVWQRAGGNQDAFVPFAILFVLIGPGLSLLARSQVEAALRRTLAA